MAHEKVSMLVATLFLARDLAHREHLKVKGPGSYAAHNALAAFYDGIVDLADSLAETYQGRFLVLLNIPLAGHDEGMSIADTLAAQREWIRKARYEAIPREETPLQNIVDEIEALYMSTLYKLKFLA
ncbi:hypothetical protein UFOVP653_57 [uncultured Caudovirales phage]|uniref:Uncharacterized protein n=1 Tax=uncultured Caudovirales phage TaxID=2100421 RepID=A0A6J5N8C5_9CAUD|nr:hypothetical protein UFOVP653_57 [uncultured Caudovirales phage]